MKFLAVVFGSAAFGAAVGCYVGGLHVLFAAVKMPLFFLGTGAVCFFAMVVVAPGLRAKETFRICLDAMTVTASGLAALALPFAFIALTAPIPSYSTYLFLVLLLVACVGGSGILSLRRLPRGVRVRWTLLYGFVGSQTAWLLRPWVGSSYDVAGYFSIHRNLEGNFYEAVFRSLVNLLRQP